MRTILTSHWGNYGLPPGQSSFAIHAIVAHSYLEGAAYPVGGAASIATAIAPTIERAGGAIVGARTLGEVKTCEIQRKAGRWYASLSIACAPKRRCGTAAIGHDWGVQTFATIAHEDGTFQHVENPRFFTKHEASVTRAQRNLDSVTIKDALGRPRTTKDPKRLAAKLALGRAKGRESNARKDFLHQTSAKIVGQTAIFATEKLHVSNLTRSAKGTAEKPGKNVSQKAGLNREILATAPAAFLSMMRYKAEEAGSLFVETPTRTLKPSQRCSDCGRLPKVRKTLADRQHVCECGCVLTRDQNGARNNLVWAFNHIGREPARNAIHRLQPWVA